MRLLKNITLIFLILYDNLTIKLFETVNFLSVIPTYKYKFVLAEVMSYDLIRDTAYILTPNITLHDNTVAEKKVIPILDMVAGEALSTLSGSKQSLALGAMTIRSPFAKVSVLLSSKTEFKFSIQTASTGPSNTIQQYSSGLSCDRSIVQA